FSREIAVAARTEVDGEIREVLIARGRIHRVALAGAERSEVLSIAVPGGPLAGRSLVVMIEDGDSPPLSLRRQAAVTVEQVRLRFLARPGERYALAVGNRGAKPPRYDLAAIPAVGRLSPAGHAIPGQLERNPAFESPEPALGAPAEGAAIDAAQWRESRRVLFAGGRVLAIEIPPEVLAATPGLADLRLVADGRQLPYILERGTVARRVVLPVESLAPERERKVSRWRVALPQRGLPLESIACEAPETVFRRQVTILDDAPPERGGRAALGSAVWERRGPGPGGPLRLALHRAPLGESLVIELDDGDNPPLTLQECTIGWRTSRLLFKQPGARAVSLLYGNPGVGPPRYDLTLLADELLAADAAAATLAPDGGRARDAGIALPGGWRRLTFWGALALVVAVLIAVIAKLLPAPKQE
ncbi:MAG TPA: hypothetical protein VN317_01075, partial [Candidatus Methanoperedens sp.]|nr:hypothetical protein [Candidatus Methanoperedens sp.]